MKTPMDSSEGTSLKELISIKLKKKLLKIQDKLNNRPRKIIGYKTPNEIMEFELKNVA